MDDTDDNEHPADKLEDWNISNDDHYHDGGITFRAARDFAGSNNDDINNEEKYNESRPKLKHSRIALELWYPYYRFYMSEHKLAQYHRHCLRKLSKGDTASTEPQGVKSIDRYRKKCAMNLRQRMIRSIKSGVTRDELIQAYHLLTAPRSLDAKKGNIMLFEYSEQHPALMSEIGMASFLKTYIGQPKDSTLTKDQIKPQQYNPFLVMIPPEARNTQQPFLAPLKAGQKFTVLENNLFRAPVFKHLVPSTDFIIFRSRDSYYLDIVNTIHVVGQQLPLMEVPAPQSYQATAIDKNYFDALIAREFQRFGRNGVPFSSIRQAFPNISKELIKRRMKKIACVQTSFANQDNRYVLRKEAQLPHDELGIRSKMTPEMYCLRQSMLQGLQRLKEAGFVRSDNASQLIPKDDSHEAIKALHDEIKAAPWNTTKAVIAAHHGKCFLDLSSHAIDPTGPAKEGFSYVKLPKLLPNSEMQQSNCLTPNLNFHPDTPAPKAKPKKRLSLQPSGNTPSKWKKTNNQAARERLEQLTRYKNECQRISDTQSNILSSDDPYPESSSEEEGEVDLGDDDDMDEMTHDLIRIISEGKSVKELEYEKEEMEREKLKHSVNCSSKRIDSLGVNNSTSVSPETDVSRNGSSERDLDVNNLNNENQGKILYIHRTYKHVGKEYETVEIVRDPNVIKLYTEKKQSEGTAPSQRGSKSGSPIATKVITEENNPICSNTTLSGEELSRTDGLRLIVSKKVLQGRRNLRLQRPVNYNYGPP